MDHGVPLGALTRVEVEGTLDRAPADTPVGMMTMRDVVVVSPTDRLDVVLEQLRESPGALALIMDRGAVFGLVTEEQLEAYVASSAAGECRT